MQAVGRPFNRQIPAVRQVSTDGRRIEVGFAGVLRIGPSMKFDGSRISSGILRPFPRFSPEAPTMASVSRMATDLVEEFVLRRWAREHYVPAEARDSTWHSIVLDEMNHKDRELVEMGQFALSGRRIVPLVPESDWILHGPHVEPLQTTVLLRIPDVAAEASAVESPL